MAVGSVYLQTTSRMVAAPAGQKGVGARINEVLDLGYKVGDFEITLGSLLAALLVLIAFMVVSAVIKRGLRRYAGRYDRLSRASIYTVERLAHYLLLTIGVLWALTIAGIPMSRLALFAGALGVGLGFGLQGIFNNFVSGLILLFDHSLRVGDFVELQSGVHGHVREIRIRFTRITTNDEIDILVPNSEFVSGRVVNWTLNEKSRRMRINFRVALDADIEIVKQAGLEAAREVPFTLMHEGSRAPQVWLNEFGESALEFQLVIWVDADATRRPSTVKAAYNWALLQAMDRHAITIPYPQRTVRMVPEGERAPASGRTGAPHTQAQRAHGVDDGPRDNDAACDVQREIAEERAIEEQAGDEVSDAGDRTQKDTRHGQDD